ncbi:hypothetical protein GIB67_001306 [Kingdonia uniflora]|uniref:Uncharacterized protein n=1 Tax=Kingdonia uniflora TaxID=39325 RepID=A0A7J7LLD5_9MAGN|nr:hypothetical protein GIB67_001306 [Kingdonia uniflora]
MMSVFQFLFYLMVLMMFICNVAFHTGSTNMFLDQNHGDNISTPSPGESAETNHSKNRKLLYHGICTNRDISISQSMETSSGIPQYIVEIVNTCMSGCSPSHIHVHCGWFASARIVNPRTFKRLSYDDCLVNEGRPLKNSQIIRFTYSNSFMYPISFKFARFC